MPLVAHCLRGKCKNISLRLKPLIPQCQNLEVLRLPLCMEFSVFLNQHGGAHQIQWPVMRQPRCCKETRQRLQPVPPTIPLRSDPPHFSRASSGTLQRSSTSDRRLRCQLRSPHHPRSRRPAALNRRSGSESSHSLRLELRIARPNHAAACLDQNSSCLCSLRPCTRLLHHFRDRRPLFPWQQPRRDVP